eukprot:3515160-Rhodomonas_salina.1
MPGTLGLTRLNHEVSFAICLHACYALSDTNVAYGGTVCLDIVVLTQRVVVPGLHTCDAGCVPQKRGATTVDDRAVHAAGMVLRYEIKYKKGNHVQKRQKKQMYTLHQTWNRMRCAVPARTGAVLTAYALCSARY